MSISHEELIDATILYVQDQVEEYDGGHDWQHINRVWKMAKYIARNEQDVDLLVIELAALLHDVGDYKFHEGDEKIGPEKVRNFLSQFDLPAEIITHIEHIINNISFSSDEQTAFHSREFGIVQDADRLDAMGAIGIARAFNYGGFKGRSIYNPAIRPRAQLSKVDYKKNIGPTINHFYEKLLLLEDKMNTKIGRKLAENRHNFMKEYLDQFYLELELAR